MNMDNVEDEGALNSIPELGKDLANSTETEMAASQPGKINVEETIVILEEDEKEEPKKDDVAKNVESEMATYEAGKMNVKESVVIPEGEEKEHTQEEKKFIEDSIMEEVMNEHNTKEEVTDGGNAKDKVMNEEYAKEEVKNKEKLHVVVKDADKPEVMNEEHKNEELIKKEAHKWMTMDNVEGDLYSISDPKKNNMVDEVETEMAASGPVKMNIEESVTFACGEEKEKHTKEEQKVNEESTQREVMNKQKVIVDENTKGEVMNEVVVGEEVNNEENLDVEIKEELNKSRKRSREEKIALSDIGEMVAKDAEPEVMNGGHLDNGLINEENTEEEVISEEEVQEEVKNKEKAEMTSTDKNKKLRKRRRKKALLDMDEVVVKDADRLEVMNEHTKQELINVENTMEEVMIEEDAKEEMKMEEVRVKSNRKIKINKLRKRRRKKASTFTNKVVSEDADQQEVMNEEHRKEELINAESTKKEVMIEEDAREEVKNEEVEVKSTEKIRKLRRSRKKALRDTGEVVAKDADKLEVMNEECRKEELINAENIKEEVMTEEDAKEEMKNEEKVMEKVSKSMRRSRKRALRDIGEVVAKDRDKPNSSVKKAKTKADTAGMIFMCSATTKKDCYQYKILGFPASKRDMVLKIHKGMTLFLFDYDLRLMYGIYKASGPGGYSIERKAFKSLFPSQVRFTVEEDCVPLAEERFKEVIKDNYYKKSKFDCRLSSEQVKNLCKLFRVASKGQKSKPYGKSIRADTSKGAKSKPFGKSVRAETSKGPKSKLFGTSVRAETSKGPKPKQETHTFVNQHRTGRQGWEQERRRPAFGSDHLYREDRGVYGREVLVSSVVAPLPLLRPLPPQSRYASERRLELDEYRRDPLEHLDQRLLDLELRGRAEHEHPAQNMQRRPLYRDPLYSAGMPSQYHTSAGRLTEYHPTSTQLTQHYPPAGRLTEYYPPAGRLTAYHPLQSLYRR